MNMSYCAMHNTNLSLKQCMNILMEDDPREHSQEEWESARSMIKKFQEFERLFHEGELIRNGEHKCEDCGDDQF